MMLKDKEKQARYSDYMNMFYSNPSISKAAREKYLKSISPESATSKLSGVATVTNIDQLRMLKEMQSGGGIDAMLKKEAEELSRKQR